MGTSIGGAIDYFVAGTNPIQATTLLAALQAADPSAVVIDGIATKASQSMVVIGKAEPDSVTAQTGSQQLLVLGAGRATEDYEIPCFVYAYRPGPTMKPARDAALALFDVVAHFIATDRTLGGLLLQGRVAEISSVILNQDIDDETGATHMAWLSFPIHCRNHYIP
jgi:hypothetical protein